MCFDDPIRLDREAYEELMGDTNQHRICWMYHDILSDPQIAWVFDRYARKGTPSREAWTTMAWVAAGRQENSFYLLFKWYEDFYSPPVRGDLYYIERDPDLEYGVRVRFLHPDFLRTLTRREQSQYWDLWPMVSENASRFFGESDFDDPPIARLLRLLKRAPQEELEELDRYLGRRSDGEKALQCATVSAYFQSVQAMEEIIYSIVTAEGKGHGAHHLHIQAFLDTLRRIADQLNVSRLADWAEIFGILADGFYGQPIRAPFLSRNVGRVLTELTGNGELRWLRLTGRGGRALLRELYCRRDPHRAWDVFHHWQGELFFTVVRRPPARHLPRGVYLLTRFEDQRGLDVTDLFWLENQMGGVAHLCEGEFFEELMELLLTQGRLSAALPLLSRREADPIGAYSHRLKEAFDKQTRGFR